MASFAFEPPLWELRIGSFRVFYDVDEKNQTVQVRAIRENKKWRQEQGIPWEEARQQLDLD